MTFGRANPLNRDRPGSADFDAWAGTPVWTGPAGCVANLEQSFTGTLDHPIISEAGRAFLSGLIDQLSAGQLRDLFETARIERRSRHGAADWVAAFERKRAEIRERRCR